MPFDYQQAMRDLATSTVNADSQKEAHINRKMANNQSKAELSSWMWAGLDANDLNQIKEALDAGASVTMRRDGKPIFWVALSRGNMEIASYLIKMGADCNTQTIQRENVWEALLPLDNAEHANQLLKWGGNTQDLDIYKFQKSPQLTCWMLKHVLNKHPSFTHISEQSIINTIQNKQPASWFFESLKHPELSAHLNRLFEVDATDPGSLEKQWPYNDILNEGLWDLISGVDHVGLAQQAINLGWGMPQMNHRRHHQWQHSGWGLAKKGAWNLVNWYRSVPALKEDMDQVAREKPDLWWGCLNSAADIERLSNLGIDFSTANDQGENAVTYFMQKSWKSSKTLIDVLVKHHEKLFFSPAPNGIAPIDLIKDAKLKAYAEMKVINGTTVKAPLKQGPARPRL